jgi:predicted DNA-binding transcriptional regulator YafY
MNGHGIRNWMLNALSLKSLLSEGASLRDRIFFDEAPSKDKFLAVIIQAIRDGRKLDICYKSFQKDYEETFVIEPYFLKEFKRRWYLYGHKGDNEGCRMIALDRMVTAVITSEKFSLPETFSARNYFGNVYGVRVYADMKPTRVLLKVSSKQSKYLRLLPLHRSQEEIEIHDEYSIFSYFITADYDFKQDVLSFGNEMEVLEPKELRKEMENAIIISNVQKRRFSCSDQRQKFCPTRKNARYGGCENSITRRGNVCQTEFPWTAWKRLSTSTAASAAT